LLPKIRNAIPGVGVNNGAAIRGPTQVIDIHGRRDVKKFYEFSVVDGENGDLKSRVWLGLRGWF
jgi:hypothetical protein